MNIGESIKTIRKQKGISQKQLAKQTGLSVNAIQSYEYGKYKPKIQQVQKIAEVLNVTPYDIMGTDYWDETTDLNQLQEDVKLFEIIIEKYGEVTASTINDFLSLTDEGQQKASEYIYLLMQKYKKE